MPVAALSPSARIRAETEHLRTALRERDLQRALASYEAMVELRPKRLFNVAAEEEIAATLRPWIEAWDDVLQLWWLATPEPGAGASDRTPWKRLVTPSRGGFLFRTLLLTPFWLRLARSERVDRPGGLEELRDFPFADQARALARFCVRADATTPVDYAATAGEIDERLRPFWAQWLLTVYMLSPLSNVDETVNENRRNAAAGFADLHAHDRAPVVPDLLLAHSGYRSVYIADRPLPFLRALSDCTMGPVFAPLACRAKKVGSATKKRRKKRKRPAQRRGSGPKTKGCGVVLTCWGEDQAVRRCMDPLLSQLRSGGVRAYFLEGGPEAATAKLPPDWRSDPVRLTCLPADELDQMAAAAGRIEGHALDFLFFPEIGLSGPSRWLATRRLARVQATGYGHPVTSGSANVDYFVGGTLVERDPSRYRERLVLIPGLGVGSTRPPEATADRTRPHRGDEVRFASVAAFDKLNARVLRTWDGVLDGASGGARLELMAGLAGSSSWRVSPAARHVRPVWRSATT